MPSPARISVPVAVRALYQRVARRLAKDGEFLKTCREDSRAFDRLGRYYIVNERNFVSAADVDLVALAKELDLLKPWEEVKDE